MPIASGMSAELSATNDLDEVLLIAGRYFTARGVKMMSYHHNPPTGARDWTRSVNVRNYGFPEAWVEEYIRNGYERIDPITSQAQTSTRPFWWSEVRRPLGREQERYLLALRRARLGDGLAVPVFGPAGRNGYVGLGFGRAVPHVPDHVVTSLLVAAQLAHGRFCELLTRGFEAVRLSPREREREILLWVAQGKSNSVIAEITAISPRTVDTHLRRIFQKLGTNDRTTAVLRAVSIAEIA